MGGKESKPITPSTKTKTTTTIVPTTVAPVPDIDTLLSTLSGAVYPRQRTVENCILVWLDAAIEKPNQDKCFVSLRGAINEINFFTELNQCIQFIHGINEDKVFVITSGSLGANLVPTIHALPQIEGIYVFCMKKDLHEQWTKPWSKVKGIFTNIQLISQALKQTTKQSNEDSVAISFMITSLGITKEELENLEASFGYAQLLKGILPEISSDETSVKLLADYCRDLYRENTAALAIINEFESDYRSHSPIWWYTRPCFLYQILNRALRTLDGETTLQMGFFIRDLYQQIEQLYQKQINTYQGEERPSIAYRGQCLSKADIEKLLKGENELIAFDGFMFASTNPDASLKYATDSASQTDKIGVHFRITLGSSVTSVPFAFIRGLSYSEMEEDILFSLHSVFRVSKITKMNDRKSLYQVDLQPVGDNDPVLQTLAYLVQKGEEGEIGWMLIINYLIHIGELDKAERICTRLLEQTCDPREKSGCYCQLGYIRQIEEDYEKALEYNEKAIEINEQIPPPNDHYLATTYQYMGGLYVAQENHSEALSYEEKALAIREQSLPVDHLALAMAYERVALLHDGTEDSASVMEFLQKALEAKEKALTPNHLGLVQLYDLIGMVSSINDDHSKALESFQKSLEIHENTIPLNYENLVETHDNIGDMYLKLKEYPSALASYEKALEIRKKIFSPEHLEIAYVYHKLSTIYEEMEDFPSTISFLEKAEEIMKKNSSGHEGEVIVIYKLLGDFHLKLEHYSDALSYYEKQRELAEDFEPDSHTMISIIYHNICLVYQHMRNLSKAISAEEKSLEIISAMPDPDKCTVIIIHQNIGRMHRERYEYAKALEHYEKVVELYDEIDTSQHPDIVKAYNDVAMTYRSVGDYAKALTYYLKAAAVQEEIDTENTKMGSTYHNIGFMYKNVKDYATAIEYYERAREAYLIEWDGNYLFMDCLEADIKFAKKRLPK